MTPPAEAGREARRRLVVALDGARAVERAARLARLLEADLFGLLAEDPALAALADHARLVLRSTIAGGAGDPAVLRRALRARRERTRQALEETGRRVGVRTGFDVFSGHLGDAAAEAADWTFLCVDAASAGDVAAVFDGGDGAHRAVDTAAGLAASEGAGLVVMLATARLDDARRWEAELRARLGERTAGLEFLIVPAAGIGDMTRLARRRGAALVVTHRDAPWCADLDAARRRIALPLLLVA